jgi:hypothetical protein
MALTNCPKCGTRISEHAMACPHCSSSKKPGEPLTQFVEVPIEHSRPSVETKKSNKSVWLISFVVFALIALIYTVSSSNSGGKSKSSGGAKAKSIDGVYTGSQNVSGLELSARLTISGDRWSSVSTFGYDGPEYNRGVVKGNGLYDESGMVKIGYVSGSSASMDGYPSMSR